jgi:predicted nucleotidyltransferase
MRRDDVLHTLRDHKDGLAQFGVASLAVFGSVARDDASPESDIDILVEFAGVATFDRYMGLKIFLEDLLGAPIDLATPRALKPRIRPVIEREAIYVA